MASEQHQREATERTPLTTTQYTTGDATSTSNNLLRSNDDHDDSSQIIGTTSSTHTHTARYYRFTSSVLNPFAALHKIPERGGQVTGLLRRSAVLPSHGTDVTKRWVLVSVGGRSGWARRKLIGTNTANNNLSIQSNLSEASAIGGFEPAPEFRQMEAWMGNHVFLCNGRIMLGSDAPLFFVTNALMLSGIFGYLFRIVPQMREYEDTQYSIDTEEVDLVECLVWFLAIWNFVEGCSNNSQIC